MSEESKRAEGGLREALVSPFSDNSKIRTPHRELIASDTVKRP